MPIPTTHLSVIDSRGRRDGLPVAANSRRQPDVPAPRKLTPEQFRAICAEARRLRAQAIGELATVIGRGIAKGARRLASAAASSLIVAGEAFAARRTYEELSRLNDYQLADLGLTREDISSIAFRRVRPAEAQAKDPEEVVEQEVREAA